MADLDIVYKIAADVSGLMDGVNRAAKSAEGLEDVANRLSVALARAFSITAAVGFAKSLTEDADALVKMSDRTGATIQGLQKLQVAGDEAGNTIEEMTGAINQLQNRMAKGDESALAAVTQLGLSIEKLRAMKPDDAFIAISDAVRQIADPTEQTRIAMELFGKSGAAVLPTLKRGFDDLKGSIVGMSDETVRKLDAAGDTLSRWTRIGKGYAAEFLVAVVEEMTPFQTALNNQGRAADEAAKHLKALGQETASEIKAVEEHAAALSGFIGPQQDASIESRIYAELLRKQVEEQKKAAEEQKKASEEVEKWNKSVEDATIHMNLSVFTLHRFGAFELPAVTSSLEGVDTEIHNLASTTLPNFNTNIYETGKRWKTVGDLLHASTVDTLPALAKAFTQLAQVSGGSFGGIAKAAAEMIASLNLGKIAIDQLTFAEKQGTATTANYIESLTTVVSAMYNIGQILLKVIPSFGDFGNIKQITNMIQLAQHLHDIGLTLDEFKEKAKAAGISLDQLFADAHDPKKFQKDLQDITDALDAQNASMQFLDDTVKKYGFSISELGPKFAQQKLTQQAFDLEKEFRALEAAGIDVSTISVHMKDAINQYLQAALKTGAAVPESMRGILQQLANMGLLTDENGNAITDLEAAGVHFSKTLDEQFADLIKTIQKLVDAITRGLGGAIDSVPTSINIDGTVTWRNDFPPNPNAPPPEGPEQQTIPTDGFATGGLVSPSGRLLHFPSGDNFPAMLSANEMVLTPAQQQQALSGHGGTVIVKTYLDGQLVAENTVQRIARDKRGIGTKARRALGVS